jgi:hypothetical protein
MDSMGEEEIGSWCLQNFLSFAEFSTAKSQIASVQERIIQSIM